jgi:linoleoyl-CoA desaturase
MAALTPIRFIPKDKKNFYKTLKSRVDAYFEENNISKHANGAIVLKTVILVLAYVLPFLALLFFEFSMGWSLLLWGLMGLSMAGIGMSIMHDANHGAYAANPHVNKWLGYTINMLGASVFNWKLQHNTLHHTFTNIVHYDDDIADKGVLRLSPHTEVKGIHRFQWVFALLVYSIVTLYWVTVKDFLQFARYIKTGVNQNSKQENRFALARIIVLKLVYFGVFFGVTAWAGLEFSKVLIGFLFMHALCGVVLTVIFQLAHTVEETTFPMPDEEGIIENEWAIHQLETTVNFAQRNRILSWYVGGLNFQVEHHLFPKVCHIHYPRIARIVKQTAKEFNVAYLEHKTFWHAVYSHFSVLHRFGHFKVLREGLG